MGQIKVTVSVELDNGGREQRKHETTVLGHGGNPLFNAQVIEELIAQAQRSISSQVIACDGDVRALREERYK